MSINSITVCFWSQKLHVLGSVGLSTVCLSSMNTSHTGNHRGGITYLSLFLLFIASHSHEETSRPLIPMKDSLARITAEGPRCCVISETSVPHHQYRLSVLTVKSGVNRLHFQRVSHRGEMRSNKPLRWILIPDRLEFACHARFKSAFNLQQNTATCHIRARGHLPLLLLFP